ncbi:MAG: hypothetical protein K2L59_04850 [Muribaculaceae bacterium]|nr:hypothetical protein [Muribaculaceae bacterium]
MTRQSACIKDSTTDTKTQKHDAATWLAIAGLTLLCVNPAYTQGENCKNLLLATAMTLSPLVLLLRRARVFIPRIDIPLCLVCMSVIAFPVIFHPASVRWITMLFTCACCVYFMMLARLVRIADLSPALLCRLIKTIIYAFAAVLVVQQICLVCGFPIFNEAKVYPMAPFKLNSLTAEPSHTSVTLGALMYFYTQTRRIESPHTGLLSELKKHGPVWACWFWCMFSPVNASAYMLAPLSLLPYLTLRNSPYWITAGIAAAIIFFTFPYGISWTADRLRKTTIAVATLDDRAILEADSSAASRIVPTLRGAKAIDITKSEAWSGHGTDADQRDIRRRPCDEDGKGFAGIFSMPYNYGVPCALAFWWAIAAVTLTRKRWLSVVTFAFAMQMSAEHNMQLVWMILAFSMVFKYDVCRSRSLLAPLPVSRTSKNIQTPGTRSSNEKKY